MAIEAWNLLGGMEWSGVELVADMLGCPDLEILLYQLAAIRDWQDKKTV